MLKKSGIKGYGWLLPFIAAVITLTSSLAALVVFNYIIHIFYLQVKTDSYRLNLFINCFRLLAAVEILLASALVPSLLCIVRKMQKAHSIKDIEMEKRISGLNIKIQNQDKQLSELKNLYSSSLEHDRLKNDFFTNIIHELKTPLSVILGAIQLMDQGRIATLQEKSHCNRHFHTIKQNCYRLLRLVNNILDLTKLEAGYIKLYKVNCNIVYLVEEIVQSVAPYAEREGLLLEFDTEAEEIFTAIDVDKLERILLNLLSNAVKFTPAGGKISVNVRSETNRVYICVKDTGPGIPASMHGSIFDRFKQVNSSLTREYEGSGIGLSLVKSFVELHNGSIRLNSSEKEGSEFTVELPIELCEHECGDMPNTGMEHDKVVETLRIEFSDIYYAAS